MFLIQDIGYNLQETYGSLYDAFIARKSVKRTELLCIGSFIITVRPTLKFGTEKCEVNVGSLRNGCKSFEILSCPETVRGTNMLEELVKWKQSTNCGQRVHG
ncbi:hypothetical protein TIFTF001_027470 [Ficus carica]|uniref:Uncharacterized protein n=1 Tax=Ficus carica TaxID=3494 RepID=A0AA88J0B4_FICCA|nr:hypothetical protein TIFTF001_027470 [Ficus carica]